jgi:hypothetical protein
VEAITAYGSMDTSTWWGWGKGVAVRTLGEARTQVRCAREWGSVASGQSASLISPLTLP